MGWLVVMVEAEVRYRYRLRVNVAQRRLLGDVFDSCRAVWNTALGRWSDLWRHEGLRFGYGDADRELTDWRGRYEWLGAQPSVPQQQVLRDLYRAVSAFFDNANRAGRPRFKARKAGYSTARWTRNGFGVSGTGLGLSNDDRLQVAVAGGRVALRVVWSRPLPSGPTSVTVLRDRVGRWWASFVCRIEVPDAPVAPTGRAAGLDVGLMTFATTEDPVDDVANPRFAKTAAKALARSQRHLARKKKGSKGRAKAGLNRSIADARWAQFRATLTWQAAKAAKIVVLFNARDTTQKCSSCGAKAKPRIELSDRVFSCRACGLVLGRDRNAARNLNPDRHRMPAGGTEPAGSAVPAGDDGTKPTVPAGTLAA